MATPPYMTALAPRLASQPPGPLSGVGATCARLQAVDEMTAWHMLNAMVGQAVANGIERQDLCTQLTAVYQCRPWQRYVVEFAQLMRRYGCTNTQIASLRLPQNAKQATYATRSPSPSGSPTGSSSTGQPPSSSKNGGGCGCDGQKASILMNGNGNGLFATPGPSDWSSSCGGYRQPDPLDQGISIASACDVAKCQGGTRVGLEMIPFDRLLVPGVPQTLTFGFTRSSRAVGLTFTRMQRPTATLAYNPDDITIRRWRTDKTIQAYDLPRQQTTYGGQDQNEVQVSIINFFEGGDDMFSPILHGMNPIPRFVPPNDIGTSDGLVQFEITLDAAAPANQTVFFWLWVLFTGKKYVAPQG